MTVSNRAATYHELFIRQSRTRLGFGLEHQRQKIFFAFLKTLVLTEFLALGGNDVLNHAEQIKQVLARACALRDQPVKITVGKRESGGKRIKQSVVDGMILAHPVIVLVIQRVKIKAKTRNGLMDEKRDSKTMWMCLPSTSNGIQSETSHQIMEI